MGNNIIKMYKGKGLVSSHLFRDSSRIQLLSLGVFVSDVAKLSYHNPYYICIKKGAHS